MLTNKIIQNKFYLYKNQVCKVKRIQKSSKKIIVIFVNDNLEEIVSMSASDLLLTRLYTIGELAKIIDKRPDTIRKYEKNGLIPKPFSTPPLENGYKNWRFYRGSDVYDMINFFSSRTPGRPVAKTDIAKTIKTLKEKVANL